MSTAELGDKTWTQDCQLMFVGTKHEKNGKTSKLLVMQILEVSAERFLVKLGHTLSWSEKTKELATEICHA